MGPLALSFTVLMVGIQHGLGQDHMLATAAYVSRHPDDPVRAALFGMRFGIGHVTTVLVLGVMALALKITFSESFERYSVVLAGVILVLLGCWLLKEVLSGKVHVHPHSHERGGPLHTHLHVHINPSHAHFHLGLQRRREAVAALTLGALFALSGMRSYLIVLPIALASSSLVSASVIILLFGIGIMLSMTAYGFAVGKFFKMSTHSRALHRVVNALTATLSLVTGIVMIAGSL